MEAVLDIQQNIIDDSNYIFIPYDFFKLKITNALKMFLGTVITFSKGKGKRCYMSYRGFPKYGAGSFATVSKGVKAMSADGLGLIEQDKSRKAVTTYNYIGFEVGDKSVRVDTYLLDTEFTFRPTNKRPFEIRRRLTRTEVLVAAFAITHSGNEKGRKDENGEPFVEFSYNRLSRLLGVSESSIQSAVNALVECKVFKRTKRGRNGYVLSQYHVDKKVIRKELKKAKKAKQTAQTTSLEQTQAKDKPAGDFRTQAEKDADARTDREEYYSRLRREAERPAELMKARLFGDGVYSDLFKRSRAMEPKIVRMEFEGKNAEKLKAEQAKLKGLLAQRMAELGVQAKDLTPRYRCPKCEDTGFRTDGSVCDCYPPGKIKEVHS